MQLAEVMGPAENTSGLYIRFTKVPREDRTKSREEGRPVFMEVDYITIMVPGDKSSEVCRPATPIDKERFRAAWERYVAGQGEVLVGIPLKEWPGATRAQVEELAYFKVYTVEQLAEVSDSNLRNMGPLLALRQRARDYLERVRSDAPMAKLRQQLESRDEELAKLRSQVDALLARHVAEGADDATPRKRRQPRQTLELEGTEARPLPDEVRG